MKKTLLIFVLIFGFAVIAPAVDVTEILPIEWTQDLETFNVLTYWQLEMSDVAGGPYSPATIIPRGALSASGAYQASTPIIVSGTPASDVVKYFVLRACIDTECSGPSNEISESWHIPLGSPSDLKILAEIQVQLKRQ